MDNYKSSLGNNVHKQKKGCQNNTIHHTIQLLLDFLVEIFYSTDLVHELKMKQNYDIK